MIILNTEQENIKNMKITIFTATYNRAYLIKNLYESICNQSYKKFEWVVVDDGSTDQTEELFNQFINEGKIEIKYIKQSNKGKHFAINKGVINATGTLFFIVDSDDKLPENSLEKIVSYYQTNKNLPKFGGLAGRNSYFDGRLVGSQNNFDTVFSNALEIRYKHKIEGDLSEVFLTNVLKEFPFPEIENEKFCPEALVWNRIAQKYNLLYFSESIYFCEYNNDGLTAKIVKIRRDSPIASMICYGELNSYKIPIKEKIKASINFWRFSFNSNLSFHKKLKLINHYPTIISLPVGFAMFILDKIKQK